MRQAGIIVLELLQEVLERRDRKLRCLSHG
jgi:hypothetical protein